MDAAKSQSNQKPSATTTSSGEYNSAMDHMSSSVALRSINTPASLYLANEMSPDSVMSELNMYSKFNTITKCIIVRSWHDHSSLHCRADHHIPTALERYLNCGSGDELFHHCYSWSYQWQ